MLLPAFIFEKSFLNLPWGFNAKANKHALHLQEQAASQGDVVVLHGQVQCCAPRLALLGVDVRPSGYQQQQTGHAVAHRGYVGGVQTCSPSRDSHGVGRLSQTALCEAEGNGKTGSQGWDAAGVSI